MNKNFLLLVASILLIACGHTKKTEKTMPDPSSLAGTWELNYITKSGIAFDSLYPEKKPTITFDVSDKKVSGYAGCNNFNGPLNVDGNTISFTSPMAMTRMVCPGNGESTFIEMLQKINNWSVTNDKTLNLITGDVTMMKFTKK